jgi:hypothetical protein
MRFFVYRESVPDGVLPAADESVVIAHRAMPMNAVQVIGTGIGHYDPRATASSRTSSTADARFIIKVCRRIKDDVGEVLG